MKIDEAVSILRAHNEWRRAPAHLPEDARPAMGDPRKIGIAIDTVCDALSKPGDWARVLLAERDALRGALEEIRSRSAMNFAMRPDPFALAAELGNIHQIADAMLKAREA
nr:hypothetical protein [Gammaproteobacteria bacterium]